MRVGLSNLAIPAAMDPGVLAGLGLSGVEVAPTRVAPWEALTPAVLRDYRARAAEVGLAVCSLQALFYGTEGPALLGDAAGFAAMAEHVRRVSGIGAVLGAGIGVFGAARYRRRGAVEAAAAWELGRERLGRLAAVAAAEGFALGLEPVPATYGCDFLTRADEVVEMVRQVGHPGLRVQLDTAGALLEGEEIGDAVAAAGALLGHFHAAEPQLGGFGSPVSAHAAAAAALARSGYDGWVAIEMAEQADPAPAIRAAVAYVTATYAGSVSAR